jgi:hypothetical protein
MSAMIKAITARVDECDTDAMVETLMFLAGLLIPFLPVVIIMLSA